MLRPALRSSVSTSMEVDDVDVEGILDDRFDDPVVERIPAPRDGDLQESRSTDVGVDVQQRAGFHALVRMLSDTYERETGALKTQVAYLSQSYGRKPEPVTGGSAGDCSAPAPRTSVSVCGACGAPCQACTSCSSGGAAPVFNVNGPGPASSCGETTALEASASSPRGGRTPLFELHPLSLQGNNSPDIPDAFVPVERNQAQRLTESQPPPSDLDHVLDSRCCRMEPSLKPGSPFDDQDGVYSESDLSKEGIAKPEKQRSADSKLKRSMTTLLYEGEELTLIEEKWRNLVAAWVQVEALKHSAEDEKNSGGSDHERLGTLASKSVIGQEVRRTLYLSTLVSSPNCGRRLCWDMIAVVLIMYEMIIFPLSAVGLEPNAFLDFMGWVTAVFWLMDMPSQFLVGFYVNGVKEMRLSRTAFRYIRSWFILDLAIVFTDWLFIILKSSSDLSAIMRTGKALRAIRILKALRMLRMGKFMELANRLLEISGVSEGAMITLKIIKLLVFVVFINHFVACAWYLIGTQDWGDMNWTTYYKVVDETFLYRYTIALHWTLSQLTPGANEVAPRNEYERVFALFVLIFGMVGFSSFLSKITSQMAQLAQYNLYRSTQDYNLRKFLHENKVSSQLGRTIWSYLTANERRHACRTLEGEATLLRDIPESILIELHVEVYSPSLLGAEGRSGHPLFKALADTCGQTYYHLCHSAISGHSLLSRHLLFLRDEPAYHMFFVVYGQFEYSERRPHGLASMLNSTNIGVGNWVSEPALWCDWIHCGFLVATKPSGVFKIDAAKFKKLTARGRAGSVCLEKYGRAFMEQMTSRSTLSQTSTSSRSSLTMEICTDKEYLSDLVLHAFPQIGSDACERLRSQITGHRGQPEHNTNHNLPHFSASKISRHDHHGADEVDLSSPEEKNVNVGGDDAAHLLKEKKQ